MTPAHLSRGRGSHVTPPVSRVLLRARKAMALPCPECEAPPNTPCVRRRASLAQPMNNPHARRLKAARSHSL